MGPWNKPVEKRDDDVLKVDAMKIVEFRHDVVFESEHFTTKDVEVNVSFFVEITMLWTGSLELATIVMPVEAEVVTFSGKKPCSSADVVLTIRVNPAVTIPVGRLVGMRAVA